MPYKFQDLKNNNSQFINFVNEMNLQENIDECRDNPCSNDASCIDKVNFIN